MKTPLTLCLLFLLSLQQQHPSPNVFEESYNQGQQLPEWVNMMYQEDADFDAVRRAKDRYYESHPFVKNTYTQYFKRWTRKINRDMDGSLYGKQDRASVKLEQDQYKQRSLALRQERGPNSAWESLGPYTFDKLAASSSYAAGAAHVYTVEQAPSNPDVFYAGTATGGLWRSDDRGANWQLLTADELLTEVVALEIDPTDEDIVFFESGGSLYRTDDGGVNWSIIGSAAWNAVGHSIKDIVAEPGNADHIFLCSDDCLYRSTDAGQSFNCIVSGSFLELEFHPTNNDIIYAVERSGNETKFWRSHDNGATFSIVGAGWPDPAGGDEQKRTEIAVSADEPDAVFALASGSANGGSGLYGVYKSADQGDSWTRTCCGSQEAGVPSVSNQNLMGWADDGTDDGGQYYYDLALAVDPNDADHILVGGVNLWVSKDGGATFDCPAKWSHSEKPNYVHADIHDIRFYGSDIWLACDGGIFYSDDGGSNYAVQMNGIQGTDFWGFGVGFQDGAVMVGGTYHNGTLLKDGDVYLDGWLSTAGGDNIRGYANYGDRSICYHDQGTVKLSGNRTQELEVTAFAKLPNASYVQGESSDMRFHPNCYNIIYTGVESQLWITDNSGSGGRMVHDFGDRVTSIEVAWNNPDIMYVCTWGSFWDTNKKIWRTQDAGATWTEITPTSLPSNWYPWDIAVSGDDDNTLWALRVRHTTGDPATNGAMVFQSTDGGVSWTNVTSASLDGEYPSNIVHQRGTDGGVYIGTRRAVYYKNNSMSEWALFNNNLPLATFSTQLLPFYGAEKIRNGSNRSAYECDFYEASMPQAKISADKLKLNCFDSAVQFVDHSALSLQGAQWLWQFPGGTPSTSTDRNPVVTYSTAGSYDVSLTVTDMHGTSTETKVGLINYTDQTEDLPALQDFEAADFSEWINTSENNAAVWQSNSLADGADCNPSTAMWVDHFNTNNVGAEFYLISNSYDLSDQTSIALSFDYSYARYGDGYEDGFRVEVSVDCGDNWDILFDQAGTDLATVADQSEEFTPSCADWQNVQLDLDAYSGQVVNVRFVAVNGWGNNFYLDNIAVNGIAAEEVVLQAKVWLEGPMLAGQQEMSTHLLDTGLLPLQHPYSDLPWSFPASSVIAFPPDVVDWLLLEARAADDPGQVRSQAVCFLRSDGQLIHTDGSLGARLPNLDPNAEYFVLIRHRNHMDILSAQAVTVNNNAAHDFTLAANITAGSTTMTNLGAARFGMLAGDFEANGVFNFQDFNAYMNTSSSLLEYVQSDCNFDGFTTVDDFNLYKGNFDGLAVPSAQM